MDRDQEDWIFEKSTHSSCSKTAITLSIHLSWLQDLTTLKFTSESHHSRFTSDTNPGSFLGPLILPPPGASLLQRAARWVTLGTRLPQTRPHLDIVSIIRLLYTRHFGLRANNHNSLYSIQKSLILSYLNRQQNLVAWLLYLLFLFLRLDMKFEGCFPFSGQGFQYLSTERRWKTTGSWFLIQRLPAEDKILYRQCYRQALTSKWTFLSEMRSSYSKFKYQGMLLFFKLFWLWLNGQLFKHCYLSIWEICPLLDEEI